MNVQKAPNCLFELCRPITKAFFTFLVIHSFILDISIAPLRVCCCSKALPTTALIRYRS